MQSTVFYSQEQKDIITKLRISNCYTEIETPFIVVMATYNFARSKNDLKTMLSEYPGMDDYEQLEIIIEQALEKGYIKSKSDNGILIHYMDDESCLLAIKQYGKDIQDKILSCRNAFQESSCVINYGILAGGNPPGGMDSLGKVYTTFIQTIKDAQKEILLPMINTQAHEVTIEALQQRAKKGVKIKILLAHYDKVASKLRNRKESSISDWVKAFEGVPNVSIRIYTNIDDAILASSVIIDRQIVRMCIFDHHKEKTSHGTLIECYKEGVELNLFRILYDKFNDIWERAHPVNEKKISKLLRNKYMPLFLAIIVLALIYFITDHEFLKSLVPNIFVVFLTLLARAGYQDIKVKFPVFIRKFKGEN